ncbi:MAG: metal-sulfur cluster assembly factor [bacterium]|nr:metal-sulfur cluster assembly factor [bacterium]
MTIRETIEQQLQTVYDPEFPVIDIRTLGLVYRIDIQEEEKQIAILMTFTTPACPMGEMIEQMVENVLLEVYPDRQVGITITFEPMRDPKMIKDEDLQRMFE